MVRSGAPTPCLPTAEVRASPQLHECAHHVPDQGRAVPFRARPRRHKRDPHRMPSQRERMRGGPRQTPHGTYPTLGWHMAIQGMGMWRFPPGGQIVFVRNPDISSLDRACHTLRQLNIYIHIYARELSVDNF